MTEEERTAFDVAARKREAEEQASTEFTLASTRNRSLLPSTRTATHYVLLHSASSTLRVAPNFGRP